MLKLYVIAFYFCKACGSYGSLKWTLVLYKILQLHQWCSGGKKQWEKCRLYSTNHNSGFSLECVKECSKAATTHQEGAGLGCALGCCLHCLLLLLVTARKPNRALPNRALCSFWDSQGIIWGISWIPPLTFPRVCTEHWAWNRSGAATGGSKAAPSTHGAAILTAGKLCFVLGYRNLKFIQTPTFFHSIH